MGTPEFAVAPLEALIKNNYQIVGVVTVPDKASGRGLKVNESAVKKYAVEHNIPVLQPVSLKDPEFLEQLKAWSSSPKIPPCRLHPNPKCFAIIGDN